MYNFYGILFLHLQTSLGCFCPQTFFSNNGLDTFPWPPLIPDLHFRLWIIGRSASGLATDKLVYCLVLWMKALCTVTFHRDSLDSDSHNGLYLRLNQWWFIARSLEYLKPNSSELHWTVNQNRKIFIPKNTFECVVCIHFSKPQCTGLILCMRPVNERWCYTVKLSLIRWAHTQNDPWMCLWNSTR